MTDAADIFDNERADLYRAFRTIAAHCYLNDYGVLPAFDDRAFQSDYVYPLIVHVRITYCNSDTLNDIEDNCARRPHSQRRGRKPRRSWWRRYCR